MNETSRGKKGWQILRRVLITLAVLATLIAIFYTEEDWRGKRAWESYKHEWEAKGEKFDWQAFVPPSVPDDQNFFKAPVFAGLSNGNWDESAHIWQRNTNVVDRLRMSIYGNGDSVASPNVGYWVKETNTDLGAWQQYYRALGMKTNEFPVAPQPQTPATDVLLALSKYNSAIEELRQAGQRPDSWLPLDYENRVKAAGEMLQYLADMKSCVQVLQLRAIAELQNGEGEKAVEDVKLMLRLDDSLRTEPYLISDLVRIAMTSITLQPVYEGLAKHQWTDAQLAELEQALAKLDFLKDFQFVERGDGMGGIAMFDYFRRHRGEFVRLLFEEARFKYQIANKNSAWAEVGNVAGIISVYLMPAGWFYQNKLALAQMHQRWDSRMMDAEQRLVFPGIIEQAGGSSVATLRAKPWNLFEGDIWPAISATARRTARIQVEVDLAQTACALERYRLAHGEYPEKLGALAPLHIKRVPHDIFGGKPLHYRRAADGKFVLYSIGWNEKDDGGVFGYPPGSRMPVFELGDWVWQYPAK